MRVDHAQATAETARREQPSDEQALFLSDAVPTGYMGADLCNIAPGDIVAVWGCGGVGLMAQRSALLMGAARVIAIDRFPERLMIARERIGSETIDYSATDSVLEQLRELTGGRAGRLHRGRRDGSARHRPAVRVDRVKQALHLHTDRGSALREAIMAVRKAGTLSVVGVYGVMDKFPLGVLMNKGVTLRTA